ncbi:MAG: hypothetical protein WD065_09285, partial [Planctomycetaceae bacterium]
MDLAQAPFTLAVASASRLLGRTDGEGEKGRPRLPEPEKRFEWSCFLIYFNTQFPDEPEEFPSRVGSLFLSQHIDF